MVGTSCKGVWSHSVWSRSGGPPSTPDRAVHDKASDIHFEPFEDEFKIRVKADGMLYEMVPPPRHLANAIVTRIKVMSSMKREAAVEAGDCGERRRL